MPGSLTTILLGVGVGRFGVTAVTLSQCAAGPALAASWTVLLCTITMKMMRTLQGARLPLQKQAAALTSGQALAAQVPAAISILVLVLPLVGLAVAGYGWTARYDPLVDRVHCSCGAAGAAPDVLLAVYLIVQSGWLVFGLILSCGPARHLTSKLHFYPWMQHCTAAIQALTIHIAATIAVCCWLWAGGGGPGLLGKLLVLCIGFSAAVLLSLPVIWSPMLIEQNERVRAKRRRVTALHQIVSGAVSPVVVDRGTNTLAQGRFPNLRRKLKAPSSSSSSRQPSNRPSSSNGRTGPATPLADNTPAAAGHSSRGGRWQAIDEDELNDGRPIRVLDASSHGAVVPPRDIEDGNGRVSNSRTQAQAQAAGHARRQLPALDRHADATKLARPRPQQAAAAAGTAAAGIDALVGLKMSALLRRAEAIGVNPTKLAEAEDSSEISGIRKQAVAELIVLTQQRQVQAQERAQQRAQQPAAGGAGLPSEKRRPSATLAPAALALAPDIEAAGVQLDF